MDSLQPESKNDEEDASTAAKIQETTLQNHEDASTTTNIAAAANKNKNRVRKITRKMGPAKGARYKKAADRATWYRACHTYKTKPACREMSNAQFLRSSYCPKAIGGYTHSTRRAFCKKLQEYEQKTLTPSDIGRKRIKPAQYPYLEEKLIAFIRMRRQEEAGVNWSGMKQQVRGWIEELQDPEERRYYDKFQISDGWISNVLKRHKMLGHHQGGENNQTGDYDDYEDDEVDDEYDYYNENEQAHDTTRTAGQDALSSSRAKGKKTKHQRLEEKIQCKMTLLKSYNEIKKSNPEWDGDIIVELFPEMKSFVEAEKKAAAKKNTGNSNTT